MNDIRCNSAFCIYVSANLCCKDCYIKDQCLNHCANEHLNCSCAVYRNKE